MFKYLFLTILLSFSAAAFADTKMKVESEADCKLVNTKKDKVLYDGGCTVKEKATSHGHQYVVKFDNGDKYKIEDTDSGYEVETPGGATKVATMRDKGQKGVFKWGNRKLVVNTKGYSSSKTATLATDGKCKLYNSKSDNYRFEGKCKIKVKGDDDGSEIDVVLGNGETYRFVEEGSRYKVETPRGWSSHKATKTGRGNKSVFEWYKWTLTLKPR